MKFSVVFATIAAAGPLRHAFIDPALSSVTQREDTKLLTGLPELPQSSFVQRSLQARAPKNAPAGTEFYMTNPDQWDQSPGREKHSERVIRAWDMALELVRKSIERLDELNKDVDAAKNTDDIRLGQNKKPRTAAEVKKRLRSFIAQSDPAYTQIFGAAVDSIGKARDNFQTVLNGITKKDAAGRDNRPIYLTTLKAPKMVNEPDDYCKSTKPGSTGTQAFVTQVKNMQYFADLRKNKDVPANTIPHDDAWAINFCDKFFETPDLKEKPDVLKKDASKKNEVCDLEKLDNTARVLLHEWTHLGFTLDTNKGGSTELDADWIGYDQAASRSTLGGKTGQQPDRFEAFSSKNADSYAWYTTYNYINGLDECKSVR